MRTSRFYLALCLNLFVFPASAVYFDSLIVDMRPEENFISRPMVNDTTRSNLYTISAYKIDKPGTGGEHRIDGGAMEVVYSPLKFTVSPNGREYFKLYYRGPKDNKERYYRVIFKESPVKIFPFRNQNQNTDIIPVVSMSSILVVRPRIAKLNYTIDEVSGTIGNSGNTFFRVIIQKGCHGDDESSTQFYMLPGEKYHSPAAKANNKKFIVAMGKYIQLGAGCFDTSPSGVQ